MITPLFQRPPSWPRTLPREWQDYEAVTGVHRKKEHAWKRAIFLALGVAVAVWIFFLINWITTPQFWVAVIGK